MFTLNNTIPKYFPIGAFDIPILKEVLHENNKIELTISGYIDNVYYEGDFLIAICTFFRKTILFYQNRIDSF